MHNQKYVFSQLLDFLDRNAFNYLARKYEGDKYVKQFTCYNQLAVLMFGQLSNRESLRDVVLATQAHAKKAFHLGFGKHASRSTLADANTKRDYRIFEEFAYKVVAEARACRADDIFKLRGNVYAFDSTTIELCLETFKWALYRKNQGKGGIKVHTLYDIETSIPTFFHITEARVHDMNAMDVIPYMKRTHSTSSTAVTMTSSVYITSRASEHTSWSEERRTTTSDRPNGLDVSSLNPASYPTLWDVWMDSSPRRSILTRSGASSTGMKRTNVSSYSSLMRWISARCLLQNSIIRDGRSSFFSSGSSSI